MQMSISERNSMSILEADWLQQQNNTPGGANPVS